jgi:hypothetical protein
VAGIQHETLEGHPHARLHHPAVLSAIGQGIAVEPKSREIGLPTWRAGFEQAMRAPAAPSLASFAVVGAHTVAPPSFISAEPVPIPTAAAPVPPPIASIPPPVSPAFLKAAEEELAPYIGAIARIVIQRALRDTDHPAELVKRLASEIEDPRKSRAMADRLSALL